jgi:HSP20 family molecular chaperone IbpA
MSSLIRRFDPFAEMSRLQDEMGGLFGGDSRRSGFTPLVDIYEDKEGFHVKAELPGVKPEEVHVNVENNMLTLRGERKLEKEDKREGYHRIERAYGSFPALSRAAEQRRRGEGPRRDEGRRTRRAHPEEGHGAAPPCRGQVALSAREARLSGIAFAPT